MLINEQALACVVRVYIRTPCGPTRLIAFGGASLLAAWLAKNERDTSADGLARGMF